MIAREGKGLTRHRFAQVLRLVALAQQSAADYPFTEENATAALHSQAWLALHGAPLPPPRIGAGAMPAGEEGAAFSLLSTPFESPAAGTNRGAGGSAPASSQHQHKQQQQQQQQAVDFFGAPAGAAMAGPAGTVPAVGGVEEEDDDLFGLKALQQPQRSVAVTFSGPEPLSAADVAGSDGRPPPMLARLSRSVAVSDRRNSASSGQPRGQIGEPGFDIFALDRRCSSDEDICAASPIWSWPTCPQADPFLRTLLPFWLCPPAGHLEPPVSFVARLPPLQPKVSAKLTLLAAANGCLFAGPAVGGGLLQWGRPEGNMRQPLDVLGAAGGKREVRCAVGAGILHAAALCLDRAKRCGCCSMLILLLLAIAAGQAGPPDVRPDVHGGSSSSTWHARSAAPQRGCRRRAIDRGGHQRPRPGHRLRVCGCTCPAAVGGRQRRLGVR